MHYVCDLYEEPLDAAVAQKEEPKPRPVRSNANIGSTQSRGVAIKLDTTVLAAVLLAGGATPNVADRKGLTPLMCACDALKPKLVAMLIGAGADVNTCDSRGHAALHIAARRASPEIAVLLLRAGANPNVCSNGLGRTPLHAACAAGSAVVVRQLISFGANVNAADHVRLEAPLHVGAIEGNIPVISTLIQNGAWVAQTTADGETPVALANRHGHWHAALAIRKIYSNTYRMPVLRLLKLIASGRSFAISTAMAPGYSTERYAAGALVKQRAYTQGVSDALEMEESFDRSISCPHLRYTHPRPAATASLDVEFSDDESDGEHTSPAHAKAAHMVESENNADISASSDVRKALLVATKTRDTAAEAIIRTAMLPAGTQHHVISLL
jgi:hypothetical protein